MTFSLMAVGVMVFSLTRTMTTTSTTTTTAAAFSSVGTTVSRRPLWRRRDCRGAQGTTATTTLFSTAAHTTTTSHNDTIVQDSSHEAPVPATATTRAQVPMPAQAPDTPPPLYLSEGLFAVDKPVDWTSNDVVSFVRGMLERDARARGAQPQKLSKRRKRKNSRIIKVGHGGTLDPLATGVLVIGVGKGTKELQTYLKGAKRYTAGMELGFETTTLDMEGNVTKRAPYDHVTWESMQAVVPDFVGSIAQVPPIFSAIRKDGKRLHEQARKGATAEDMELEARTVDIYELNLLETTTAADSSSSSSSFPPKLEIDVACGGGTYIRSLVRDLGYAVDSVATTTFLRRTQQGPFCEKDCLSRDEWTVDNIYHAVDRFNKQQPDESVQGE